MAFSGGCGCGAVRYECSGEPMMMFECHCRDCQHASGGGYSAVVYLPAGALTFTKGEPRYFSTESLAGGKNKRGFCAECGSRICGGESEQGIGVLAGSLDDPSWFRPQVHMHMADAQPWDAVNPAIPRFDGYPPPPSESVEAARR
jgi:hypothetical protein